VSQGLVLQQDVPKGSMMIMMLFIVLFQNQTVLRTT